MNAQDVKVDDHFLKTFVCGEAGTGKSVFARSFPTPAYLFNFDKTELTYRGKDFEYNNYEQTAQGWVAFEKDFRELKRVMKSDSPPYKTIVLDSTTTWTDLAMERAMQLDPKRSATNGPLWNVHYGMVKNLLEGYLRQLLEFKCNVVVIGHVDYVFDDDGAIMAIKPLLTGQLSSKVPGYFDEVYYSQNRMVKGKPTFDLLTVAKGHYKARSRLSGVYSLLPQTVPNNYGVIMDLIRKGGSGSESITV